jgi:hypothetical protein
MRNLKWARRAYSNAVKDMFLLKIDHREFDQITANAERLKFELESLESVAHRGDHGLSRED